MTRDGSVSPDGFVATLRFVTGLDQSSFKRLANNMSRAFRDSHGGGIVERFEAVSKLLFMKVVDERIVQGRWPGVAVTEPALVWRDGDVARTVYERAQQLWMAVTGGAAAKVLKGDRSFPKDVEAVARCVRLLQDYELDAVGVDVKGAAYEELLRNTFEKNDNQQYFTPRHLMDFVVQLADPQPDSIVCDPACGSGGFLVGALAHVARGSHGNLMPQVFGVDIDERMAWVARINVFLHGGDPVSISHMPGAGALQSLPQVQKVLPRAGFTHILTNPPFGSDMTDRQALAGFSTGKGRSTRRRGVLFIERCLELLQPGGLLAVVIDDSILNLSGNSDIRALVRERALVEAVISLPDVTFMPYSTAKSSVLVLRRRTADVNERQGPVFMADVEQVGNRPNGDPLYQDVPATDGVRPLLSDLPEVATAWRHFQLTGKVPEEIDPHRVFAADIDAYAREDGGDRLDVNFHHPTRVVAAATLARAQWPTHQLNELFDFEKTSVNVSATYGDAAVEWIGLGDIVSETGEFATVTMPGDRIKSSAHSYQDGDVLVSRLRPKLRKVIHVPRGTPDGVCSAELVVLRLKSNPAAEVLPEFVAYMLRTDLAYGQQVYQITGVGRPRVGINGLKKLQLPIPDLHTQRALLGELDAAFEQYRKLRSEADSLIALAHRQLHGAYASSVRSVTASDDASWSARASTTKSSGGSAVRAAI